jgi:glucan phosphoethanolaminetransferase (alkaline phosphatase superfamily)
MGLSIMVFVLFICVVAVPFLRKARMKMLIGLIMSIMAAAAMGFFCYVQRINGNPDQGMELLQWYLPLTVYLFFIASGIMVAINATKAKY